MQSVNEALFHAGVKHQIYLQRYKAPPACRFDVVAIDANALEWLKNAIEA